MPSLSSKTKNLFINRLIEPNISVIEFKESDYLQSNIFVRGFTTDVLQYVWRESHWCHYFWAMHAWLHLHCNWLAEWVLTREWRHKESVHNLCLVLNGLDDPLLPGLLLLLLAFLPHNVWVCAVLRDSHFPSEKFLHDSFRGLYLLLPWALLNHCALSRCEWLLLLWACRDMSSYLPWVQSCKMAQNELLHLLYPSKSMDDALLSQDTLHHWFSHRNNLRSLHAFMGWES